MATDNPLYCDTCHTKWIEACLSPFDPCPFRDCSGVLRYDAPVRPVPVRRPRDRSLPLFDRAR